MGRVSREIFKPGVDEDWVYLHVFNHCVETGNSEFPFGDLEKEKFLRHLNKTLILYSIECLGAVVMSNHYHLILYVPKESFSLNEMTKRIKRFKKGKVHALEVDFYTQRRHEMSNDLSSFMKELQQGFTCWFNKTRHYRRRGTLWEQRFKCTKLASMESLATCLQYVELNPVRAEIVNDPADYRFCTYGIWQQKGKHPYKESFEKHLVSALKIYLDSENLKGLETYFRERFAGIIASKNREKSVDASPSGNMLHPLLRRSRFWIDSLVLGGRIILKEHAADFWGEERAQKKKFGNFYKNDGVNVLSMRQLMVDIN